MKCMSSMSIVMVVVVLSWLVVMVYVLLISIVMNMFCIVVVNLSLSGSECCISVCVW